MKNLTLIFAVCASCVVPGMAKEVPLVDLVNPLMGTDNPGGLSKGITIPAVALPFPMNAWTAATSGLGYDYRRTNIVAFRQRHLHTSRMGDFANFALMPVFGKVAVTPAERTSTFRHEDEIARPSYYKVHLDTWKTTAEMTATERDAQFRFTYEEAGDGYVVFDIDPANNCSVEIIPGENKIIGISRNNGGGVPRDGSFASYIVIVFDRPFTGHGVFVGPPGGGRRGGGGAQQPAATESIKDGETKLTGSHVGAYVKFDTGPNKVVGCKVASSYISPEQAMLNLQQELGSASFDTIRQRAESKWNEALGRAKVEGGTEQQQRTFYSCLYRAVLFPEKFYEINAQGKPVHYSPYDGKLHDGVLYTDSGFWDTFRAAHPLINILFPEVSAEIQQSLINTFEESGWLPEWPGPGHRSIMIGQNSFSLLADAWMKGIRGFDAEKALAAMLHDVTGSPMGAVGRDGAKYYNELGYLPFSSTRGEPSISEATAKTLEYAYDDYCAAQLAHAIGKNAEAETFAKHAMNYSNLFDPKVGFMRERKADGSWNEPFAPETWSSGFTEGSSWHWTWCVFQDIPGLANLMGGDEAFAKKLDEVFTTDADAHLGGYHGGRGAIHEMTEMVAGNMGQYAHGNEPVHHMIYLYNYAGQPWKGQARLRQVMNLLYSATPDGYCGDEDTGQMSAWFVFSALGFYPVCPGDPNYIIGSPLFNKATLKLGNGKTFTILANGNGYQEYYIRSATLDGEPLTKTYFSHQDMMKGGELVLNMSSGANKQWGSSPESRPPSALATLLATFGASQNSAEKK